MTASPQNAVLVNKVKLMLAHVDNQIKELVERYKKRSYCQQIKSNLRQAETLVIQRHDFIQVTEDTAGNQPVFFQ